MLDLQQLHQLLTISEHGTLSAAAKVLHLSQPALTRSMQRLEEQFGVPLFDRTRNKAVLNEAGQLAVERAKLVLETAGDMERRMADYARSQHTIALGSCAPGPMWLLTPQLSARYPDKTIASEMKEDAVLREGLTGGSYHLVLLDHPAEGDGVLCKPYFREQLFVSLPPAHPLSQRESVTLADLAGQTMLLFSDLGVWQRVLDEQAKDVRFIVQTERQAFTDLISASVLPSFTTNLTALLPAPVGAPPIDRVSVPVSDEAAVIQFYVCALKKNRRLFDSIEGRVG